MPFDSILVSAPVVFVFAIFAGVLIWGDFLTEPERRQPANRNGGRRGFRSFLYLVTSRERRLVPRGSTVKRRHSRLNFSSINASVPKSGLPTKPCMGFADQSETQEAHVVAFLVTETGSYKVVNGQFIFPFQSVSRSRSCKVVSG